MTTCALGAGAADATLVPPSAAVSGPLTPFVRFDYRLEHRGTRFWVGSVPLEPVPKSLSDGCPSAATSFVRPVLYVQSTLPRRRQPSSRISRVVAIPVPEVTVL